MLLFKQAEEDKPVGITLSETVVENHSDLLSDRPTDELLAELQDLLKTHRRNRKRVFGMFIGGMALYALVFAGSLALSMTYHPGNLVFLLLSLLGALSFLPLGLFGGIGIGRGFFKRGREKLHSIVPALAQRREMRTLPILLDLMDIKYSGILMWQESRPVLLQALELLLERMSPEEFQEFSRQQVWDILSMLYFPDGSLREVIADMAVRCGDSRTLDSLQNLQRLYGFGVSTAKSPFMKWNPMLWYLKKEGVPVATPEGEAVIDRALASLTAQVGEMRRNSQLLRASQPDQEQASRELVRAAAPTGAPDPSDKLLRPVSDVNSQTIDSLTPDGS